MKKIILAISNIVLLNTLLMPAYAHGGQEYSQYNKVKYTNPVRRFGKQLYEQLDYQARYDLYKFYWELLREQGSGDQKAKDEGLKTERHSTQNPALHPLQVRPSPTFRLSASF